ncbi:MAG: hypothetical protein KME01_09270 [Chroococcus sp. CMT-3BRIN-NPC107]|nr:hypothetical protein [Chroococcus sp. CMT-3BRIN-NPC107]
MNYKDLKLISSKELAASQTNRESWLSKVWQKLITYLSQSSGLQIWQSKSKGNEVWELYNPTTGDRLSFDSETDVRTWIEESYYRPVATDRQFKPYAWYQIER